MSPKSQLIAEADQCVMCGLCLPHCPTYGVSSDEAESPRGRISLMKAFLTGELDISAPLVAHLDHCLACRACEAMCPSGVRYGQLLVSVRALLADDRVKVPPLSRLLRWVVSRRNRLRFATTLLRAYQRSGLRRLLRTTGFLDLMHARRLDDQLPETVPKRRWDTYYPAQGATRGAVALFLGCIAEVVDRRTLAAAVQVITRLGYGVHVPDQQVCCGALHYHGGDLHSSRRLAHRNVAAFADIADEPVITTASGCAAMLSEYPSLLEGTGEQTTSSFFARRIRDISQFLGEIDWPPHATLEPLRARVAVHDPCSLAYVLQSESYPYSVLARIPEIELFPLAGNPRCCGSAGSYVLTQAALAERLRAEKLTAIDSVRPDIVVTSNIGCALHLQAGIRRIGLDIEVVHPITLVARQLRPQPVS